MAKRITTKAFAIVIRNYGDDIIDLTRIEPFTDEGRRDLIRQINRPAGERVCQVTVTVAAKPARKSPAPTGKQAP